MARRGAGSIHYFDSRGESVANDSMPGGEEFFPRGAIAFFVAMIVVYGLIWLGIYLLLVHRQLGL